MFIFAKKRRKDMERNLLIELLEDNENPAHALVERALEHGGVDNTTCVVVQV